MSLALATQRPSYMQPSTLELEHKAHREALHLLAKEGGASNQYFQEGESSFGVYMICTMQGWKPVKGFKPNPYQEGSKRYQLFRLGQEALKLEHRNYDRYR